MAQRDGRPVSVVVTLVHGTWGRGFLAAHCGRIRSPAGWTRETSSLVTGIRDAAGADALIEPFDWSGRNSHRARVRAGRALGDHLTALIERYPGAAHAIVAHSHGGNAAMYAVRTAGLAARIGAIVCMATPFVT